MKKKRPLENISMSVLIPLPTDDATQVAANSIEYGEVTTYFNTKENIAKI
jgi:hypothetical protein